VRWLEYLSRKLNQEVQEYSVSISCQCVSSALQ
jgi:hypothetical protein